MTAETGFYLALLLLFIIPFIGVVRPRVILAVCGALAAVILWGLP